MFPPSPFDDEALESVVVDPALAAELAVDPFAETNVEVKPRAILQPDEKYLAGLVARHKRIKDSTKRLSFKNQAKELVILNDQRLEEAVRSGVWVPPDELGEGEDSIRLVDAIDVSCEEKAPLSLHSICSAMCSCTQRVLRRYWQGY
jgi:hypothetical protein